MKHFLPLRSKTWKKSCLLSSKHMWGPRPSRYSRTVCFRGGRSSDSCIGTASGNWWNRTQSSSFFQTAAVPLRLQKQAWVGFSAARISLRRAEEGTVPYQFRGKNQASGMNFAPSLRWRSVRWGSIQTVQKKQLPLAEASRNKNKGRFREKDEVKAGSGKKKY